MTVCAVPNIKYDLFFYRPREPRTSLRKSWAAKISRLIVGGRNKEPASVPRTISPPGAFPERNGHLPRVSSVK